MTAFKALGKSTFVRQEPNNIKKVIKKVLEINKLGKDLDKEVSSLKDEISKWRI